MEFEWDPEKRLRNLAKHGVLFEDASRVFFDPAEITEPANTIGGEERFKTIGRFDVEAVLLVVHTIRHRDTGKVIRIISARAASRSERKHYERREP